MKFALSSSLETSLHNMDDSLSLCQSFYRWTMALNQSYRRTWPFYGWPKDSFGFSQEIRCKVTKEIRASLGPSLRGSALTVNVHDSDVRLFDRDYSTIFKIALGFKRETP